jgi:CRISPR-associated protein Csb2
MPTTLAFRFISGHYHATPWSSHVNEGHIEWPPSPWRLLRALIAVGYTTLWSDGIAPGVARRLLERLAAVQPRYLLPEMAAGHTRHYMPLGWLKDGREDTTLVLDAFAHVGNGILHVSWPVDLADDERALLGELAARMTYLGRAESWVDATLVADDGDPDSAAGGGAPCWPSQPAEQPAGPDWEQVSLLATLTADGYEAWRAEQLAALDRDRQTQCQHGKRLTAAQQRSHERATAAIPADLWDCLTRDTGRLRADGWGQPPGSQQVRYWRPAAALAVTQPQVARPHALSAVECVLLAVTFPSGNRSALPTISRALPQAELLHQAAVGRLGRGALATEGFELVGKSREGKPLRGNRHAHFLPLDLDGDQHLDHILVWAPGGLSQVAVEALRAIRQTWTKNISENLRLAVAAIGRLCDLQRLPAPYSVALDRTTGSGTVWSTATPFVPPRFLKAKGPNTWHGQIVAELTARGLPEPSRVELWTRDHGVSLRFQHFVRERRSQHRPPPQAAWCGFTVEFAEPVAGPICIGYASHFGLGRLERATSAAPW